MPNTIKRVADRLMSRLADAGVDHVFCLPGGGAMYLDDALTLDSRITPIVCHHEQACGISAEAYGRTSKAGFGVAVVTTGPGATNVLTPVAGAWIESLPLLVISGQVKRADMLGGRPLRQTGVQEVDVVTMVKSVTKYAKTISDPLDVDAVLDEALWHMSNGRPGPVWIDVPLDIQAALVDLARLRKFIPPPKDETKVFTDQFDHLNQLILKSKRPLVLAGHGVRISGAHEEFREWIAASGMPVALTWNAMDLLSWDDPLFVGRPGVVGARAANFALQNADLLICIGCRVDNVVSAYNSKEFARNAIKVVVDVDRHEIEKHAFEIELSFHADAKKFIIEAKNAVTNNKDKFLPWKEVCQSWKRRYLATEGRDLACEGSLNHYAFIESLSEFIPSDRLVVTGSSGLAVEVFYSAFKNKPGQRIFLTSGLGAMGYGLCASIGAHLGASTSSVSYCIESDGSLMLNLQELATLSSLRLPIIVLIMNNRGYASIRNTQKNYFDGRLLGSDESSGLWMPSFEALAKSFGLTAFSVKSVNELRDLLKNEAELVAHGPVLIDVFLDPNEVLAPKCSALPQADGSMISMPLEDMTPLLPLNILEQEMLVPLSIQSLKARGMN